MSGALLAMLRREAALHWSHPAELLNALFFHVLVVLLFTFAVGPYPQMLSQLGAAVIWVAALLATMLSTATLFQSDYDDGSLELIAVSPQPLSLYVVVRVTMHWLLGGVPLILLTPLLGLMTQLDSARIVTLMLSLLVGTPTLGLISGIGAALTVGVKRGGMLTALLVLPLFIPVLIFGSMAVQASASGLSANGPLLLMAAMLVLSLALAPVACAAALRNALA
ncbi:heme exporter protein CcmB [Gammaproteobacteria bacterium]|nr:heme exporter protein CcmB [Gammaproteobacteria bacterium]